ncbi:Homeobox-DDT domain protein RLT2 [Linum perenne]
MEDSGGVATTPGGGGGGGGSCSSPAVGGGSEKKSGEGDNKSTKRKMKTASQLEVLERTYAAEAYPSEALRIELSAQLGLSDRQLQMWFCHRRLKDRKGAQAQGKRQRKDSPPPAAPPPPPAAALPAAAQPKEEMVAVSEVYREQLPASTSRASPFGHVMDPRRLVARTPGVAVPRISGDLATMKRYYEPQHLIEELRAIAFVEAQLGEPLREDGPILGMEFDSLPPDAFGAPIGSAAAVGHQKAPGRHFESNVYERSDVKAIKGPTRALHEYQFLPQQPSVRADGYERTAPLYPYGSPSDSHNTKNVPLSTGRPFMHGNEQSSSGYGFPGQVPSLSLMPQEVRQGHHLLLSSSGEFDTASQRNSFSNMEMDAQLGPHAITALDNPFTSADRRVDHTEDVLRMERKRKSEEARLAREVEAHEKRIRKELERQDILRRKREEQIRKDLERQERERRKEEERLMREKQREEERYQREQRREMERREKFLQKESLKAERMRQKEEMRREREVARQKAATERAHARRIAKESVELIEDEKLELMELAASNKGLPSLLSLDFESLQNLDLFRGELSTFPPKSVPLRRPFAVQPWSNSEENIGNLLMVWRFIITFTDVLGLWPFTFDEFVQAFHDYDPRLLGEIHVALLKSIIKDIEDVGRPPVSGLGANQNSSGNPGGGHPRIVEGAYAWGFDIRNWQRHLNPLTWPEILRQFGLSAGFGPRLKRRKIDHFRDDNEGNDGKDVISNLRNGAAVENAVAIMHERGFSNPRRSRHRLTPGTVKYAAFHILSVEGSNGLSILDVAEKIQKSGLRDLSTSKTPEASIAAALSRDTKLFERTAPSTYCVRTPYRKDPFDAEAILSAAREKIQIFKSGLVEEDADEAERDEDSESDVAEDPEVDDLDELGKIGVQFVMENGKEENKVVKKEQVCVEKVDGSSSVCLEGANKSKGAAAAVNHTVGTKAVSSIDGEDADIDESNPGELWVQGLTEGEYSDLSVEERLNALVALIGVTIEGSSIRLVLEERLDAANALKKQMWAEAQLDKRRTKEEYFVKQYSSFSTAKMDYNLSIPVTDGKQSPLVALGEQPRDLANDVNLHNNLSSEGNTQIQDLPLGTDNVPYQHLGYVTERSRSQLKSFVNHKAEETYVYRSLPLGLDRRRNRYWQFVTCPSRNDPGCGRIFVELHDGRWRLIDSEEGFDTLLACLDVRGIRESHLHFMLRRIEKSFKETVRRNVLQVKTENSVLMVDAPDGDDSPRSAVCPTDSDACETSTSFAIEIGRNRSERNSSLKRYYDFERWMWKECSSSTLLSATKYGQKRCTQLLGICADCHDIYLSEDDSCPSCNRVLDPSESHLDFGQTFKVGKGIKDPHNFNNYSPLRIRALKLLLALIEVSLPPEALQPFWTSAMRKSWSKKLWSMSSAEEQLQALTVLEAALRNDYLSSNFETTSELLGLSDPPGFDAATISSSMDMVPLLPWLPRTTAAVALRVMEFDASIAYILQQKVKMEEEDKIAGDFSKLYSSKYAVGNSSYNIQTFGAFHKGGAYQDDSWLDVGNGSGGFSNGRGNRGRNRKQLAHSGRSQRRVTGPRSDSRKRNVVASSSEGLGQGLAWKGRPRIRGGRKRGRRSARSRQKSAKTAAAVIPPEILKETIYEKPSSSSRMPVARDEWNEEARFPVEVDENASSSERSDYDDEIDQQVGDEYYDDTVAAEAAADDYPSGDLNGKLGDFQPLSDDDMEEVNEEDQDEYQEEEEEEEDEDEYEDGRNLEVDGYINAESDEDEDEIREEDRDPDGTASSSDFSD